jgi:alkanesulfonate monooxygenase SsuD/methylene tetrahydromethanopterin reductase-like flavin-dependent oxidoreductase (luciferase family)
LARRLADEGLRRALARSTDPTKPGPHATLDELIARQDVHVGTPDEVIASLRADRTLAHVTDLVCQVHSVDPPHRHILRSIELLATKVGPALGWAGSAGVRHSLSPPTQAFA